MGRRQDQIATVGQLKTSVQLPVVEFQTIDLDLPDPALDSSLISTHQNYSLDMARGIAKGYIPQELAARDPGEMNNSRWGTTASRVMRVYIGTRRPTVALRTITKIIMALYIPIWFTIKKYWTIAEGAKHA